MRVAGTSTAVLMMALALAAADLSKPPALLPETKPQQRPVYRWKGARKRGGRS